MFVKFETKKHEQVVLNINHIISFAPISRGGSLIMMSDGMDFEVVADFNELCVKLPFVQNSSFTRRNFLSDNPKS